MDTFEYNGIWWLPQYANYSTIGKLIFDPIKGARLETIGDKFLSFVEEERPYTKVVSRFLSGSGRARIGIICGFAEGHEVTLYENYGGFSASYRGYNTERFSVGLVIWGCHFEREEDIVFDTMSINYPGLNRWVGVAGFDGFSQFDPVTEDFVAEVKYASPPPVRVSVNDNQLSIKHSLNRDGNSLEGWQLSPEVYLQMEPAKPLTFEQYQSEIVYPFRNFLNLAMSKGVSPIWVRATSPTCVRESHGKSQKIVLSLYYRARTARELDKPDYSAGMLFLFRDVSATFEHHLRLWFQKFTTLRPICELYFGILYASPMLTNFEFIAVAQALEAYHREMYKGEHASKKEYKPIRKALSDIIPQDLDDDFQKSIREALSFAYQYRLRTRLQKILTEVLSDYSELVEKLVGNIDQFVDLTVKTRNYWTHFDPSEKSKAVTDANRLSVLTHKLGLILQLCFLKELEIPNETVEKMMRQNREFEIWSNIRVID